MTKIPRSVEFDNSRYAPVEIAAQIYAVLAFPGRNETQSCISAATCLVAERIQLSSPDVRADSPEYAALPVRQIRRALRTMPRRLRDRSWAAWIAFGYLQEISSGRPAELPEGMRKLSVGAAARFAGLRTGESDPKNFEKRGWRESKPVVHLASALARMVELGRAVENPETKSLSFDFEDTRLHRDLVLHANLHAEMLIAHPKFRVRREDLIELRWIGAP